MNFISRFLLERKDTNKKLIREFQRGRLSGQREGVKQFDLVVKEKDALIIKHAQEMSNKESEYQKKIEDLKSFYEIKLAKEKDKSFSHRSKINNEYSAKCDICQLQLDKTYQTIILWKDDIQKKMFKADEIFAEIHRFTLGVAEEVEKQVRSYGRITSWKNQLDDISHSIDTFSKELPSCMLTVPPALVKISH